METALTDTKLFTYEDLHSIPEGNHEIIDGGRVDMTPTGFKHGKLELKIARFIEDKLKNDGFVAVGEVGIVITKQPFRLRAADVVYISKDTSNEEPEGILEIAPDLVVEILSKDDTVHAMNDKVEDYLSIGVKKILLVDPYSELITVYGHEKNDARYYRLSEEFDLFAGIKIKFKDIF